MFEFMKDAELVKTYTFEINVKKLVRPGTTVYSAEALVDGASSPVECLASSEDEAVALLHLKLSKKLAPHLQEK